MLKSMAKRLSRQVREPTPEDIRRWERLFCLHDTRSAILEFRNSPQPTIVDDDHWRDVREKREPEGHDRESYEYSLTDGLHVPKTASVTRSLNRRPPRGTFLLRLMRTCKPIATPEDVQRTAGLTEPPLTHRDSDGEAEFVEIPGIAKMIIEDFLDERQIEAALFIRRNLPAPKALDTTSKFPFLSIDTTLPQHRPPYVSECSGLLPQQDTYPVLYFFYGTLTDPNILREKLGLQDTEAVSYKKARVQHARLTTWGGKYQALVEDSEMSVDGQAFRVMSKEWEDSLRDYETDHYEVVRCEMDVGGEVRYGLTFRFLGSD